MVYWVWVFFLLFPYNSLLTGVESYMYIVHVYSVQCKLFAHTHVHVLYHPHIHCTSQTTGIYEVHTCTCIMTVRLHMYNVYPLDMQVECQNSTIHVGKYHRHCTVYMYTWKYRYNVHVCSTLSRKERKATQQTIHTKP